MPDIFGIFPDSTVGCKIAGGGDIHERHAVPAFAVAVSLEHTPPCFGIKIEIGETHERIGYPVRKQKVIEYIIERTPVEAGVERIHGILQRFVAVIII